MEYCKKCGSKLDPQTGNCPNCENRGNSNKQREKGMAILAYIGILVLIPLFFEKESESVRFHINQGLLLVICEVIYGVIYSVCSAVLLSISWHLYFLVGMLGVVRVLFLILSIFGIANVCTDQKKELPIIGHFSLIK